MPRFSAPFHAQTWWLSGEANRPLPKGTSPDSSQTREAGNSSFAPYTEGVIIGAEKAIDGGCRGMRHLVLWDT